MVVLVRRGHPRLSFSAFCERNREEHGHRLLLEWSVWLAFFWHAIGSRAKDAVRQSDNLLTLRLNDRVRLQSSRAFAWILLIVEYLFIHQAISSRISGGHW